MNLSCLTLYHISKVKEHPEQQKAGGRNALGPGISIDAGANPEDFSGASTIGAWWLINDATMGFPTIQRDHPE